MERWVGHLGSGLMLVFLALLALRCAGQLCLFASGLPEKQTLQPVPARQRGFFSRAARWEWDAQRQAFCPGFPALAEAFLGVLAIQWGFAFVCWLGLRQPGGLYAFFAHFWQRFTTAGDSPHYLLLARQGYVTAGEDAKYIVFYPLYPLLIRAVHGLLAPFGWGGRLRPWP